jgi:hypothetical protein
MNRSNQHSAISIQQSGKTHSWKDGETNRCLSTPIRRIMAALASWPLLDEM